MTLEILCPWRVSVDEITYPSAKRKITYFEDCYGDACPFYAEDEIYKNGTKKITVKCVRTGSKEE